MNLAQLNFGAGEINVRMQNRLDDELSQRGLHLCQNVLVTNNGSLVRRPGTDFISTIEADRLQVFMYAGTQYVLAFKDDGSKFWVYQVSGDSLVLQNPTAGVTIASPVPFNSFAETPSALYVARLDPATGNRGQLGKITKGTDWTWTAVPLTSTDSVNTGGTHGGTKIYDAWKQDNADRYPSHVAAWRGRLWLSGQKARPSALGASNVNAYESMTDTYKWTNETNAAAFPEATEINAIDLHRTGGSGNTMWLLGQKILYQGTDSQELILQESVEGRLNPNIYTRPLARYENHGQVGSTSKEVVSHSSGPIHINGDAVRILQFSTEKQAFDSTSISDHATISAGSGYRQMVSMSIPFYVIWLITEDGLMYGCTYDPVQEVIAWHRHTTLNTDGTAAKWRSCAVVRRGTAQDVYYIVRRKINGVETNLLERMRPIYPSAQNVSACLDCAKTSDANTIDMSHLTGTITLMTNGADGGTATASAAVTVTGATKIVAGIPYDSIAITPPKRVVQEGIMVDPEKIKLKKATLIVHNAMGIQIGTEGTAYDLIQGRQWTDLLGQAPQWVSGEIDGILDGPYAPQRMTIKSTAALPWEIMGIIIDAHVAQ